MKTIKLDDHYSIEFDTFNCSLLFRREKEVTKKNKETGEEELKTVTEKTESHYPNLQGCLRKYLDESLKESESIQEVLKQIELVHQTIKSLKI